MDDWQLDQAPRRRGSRVEAGPAESKEGDVFVDSVLSCLDEGLDVEEALEEALALDGAEDRSRWAVQPPAARPDAEDDGAPIYNSIYRHRLEGAAPPASPDQQGRRRRRKPLPDHPDDDIAIVGNLNSTYCMAKAGSLCSVPPLPCAMATLHSPCGELTRMDPLFRATAEVLTTKAQRQVVHKLPRGNFMRFATQLPEIPAAPQRPSTGGMRRVAAEQQPTPRARSAGPRRYGAWYIQPQHWRLARYPGGPASAPPPPTSVELARRQAAGSSALTHTLAMVGEKLQKLDAPFLMRDWVRAQSSGSAAGPRLPAMLAGLPRSKVTQKRRQQRARRRRTRDRPTQQRTTLRPASGQKR